MRKPIQIILLFFYVQISLAFAQEIDFTPFYYSGYTPPELNINSADRLAKLYNEYELDGSSKQTIDKKQFVYEYNYFLDRLNKSGNVFYGDSISKYLNDLKDIIISDSSLRNKVKVYLVDFPYLNAFTNDFGSIYVNIATLARLESEEELMFLLSHEIGHIILNHSFKSEENRKKQRSPDWNVSSEKEEFEKHAFSRKQEFEADSIAYELMKGKIDLNLGVNLFNKLNNSENPLISGKINLQLLAGNDELLFDKLTEYWKLESVDSVYFELKNSDSLSTHPSVDKRIERWKELQSKFSGETEVYTPLRNFYDYKIIATSVLLNTYINDDKFIEGLDLILKLRESNPENVYLKNQQVRVLSLIAQAKYEENSLGRILNANGNACNDIHFLELKKFMMELTPIDLNIISYVSQKSLNISDSFLVQTAIKKNYCSLYKKNEQLFTNDSLNHIVYDFAADSMTVKLEPEDKAIENVLKKLKKEGYHIVSRNNKNYFVTYFLNNHSIDSIETTWIKYVEQLKTEVYPDDGTNVGDLFIHPAIAARRYRKGEFYKSESFDPTQKSSLFQIDNYYFKSRNKYGFKIDYEKTLNLEKKVLELNVIYNPYFNDYSNLNNNKVSVQDNYIHKIIWSWMLERSENGVLHYSKNEADFYRLVKSTGTKYLVYNFFLVNRNKGRGRKYNTNYYEIYFDIDKQEIAYASKLGSVIKNNIYQLENCIYQSNYEKTNE